MRKVILLTTGLFLACEPAYTQKVKSPDEILAEQEKLGADQEKKTAEQGSPVDSDVSGTGVDEKEAFDATYTDIEIKRAVRSAETCPGVTNEGPYGTLKLSVTFGNDGRVMADKTSMPAPFAETKIGACIGQAVNKIITKNFVGQPVTKEISMTLTEVEKKPEPTKKKK